MPMTKSPAPSADIVFDVVRKANFHYGVMQRQADGTMDFVDLTRRKVPVDVRGAMLDKVTMTDTQTKTSVECYAMEPPLGTYKIKGGKAGKVKDYPVVKAGTYTVTYQLANSSPGPEPTAAEKALGEKGHRTFWLKAGSDTLFHYGAFPEMTEGCFTVGQKPKLVILKQQFDDKGKAVLGSGGKPQWTGYDQIVRHGVNPALPAEQSQNEANQQSLLNVSRTTVYLQDCKGALGAMLDMYDHCKARIGREPKMAAVVSPSDKIQHFDLNDSLQCPVGRSVSF